MSVLYQKNICGSANKPFPLVFVDINKFLEEQINSGSIKAEALNQALKIIDRSKYQIERIDGITPQNDDYVVMHNNGSYYL